MAPVCSPSRFAATFPSFLRWHNLLISFLSSLPSLFIYFTQSTMVSITTWYDLSTLRCTFLLHCVKNPPYKLLPPCLSFSTTVYSLFVFYLPTTPLPSAFSSFYSSSRNASTALISAQCTVLNYVFIDPNLFSPCLTKTSPHPCDRSNHCHHRTSEVSLFVSYLLPSSSPLLLRRVAVLWIRVIVGMILTLISFDMTQILIVANYSGSPPHPVLLPG